MYIRALRATLNQTDQSFNSVSLPNSQLMSFVLIPAWLTFSTPILHSWQGARAFVFLFMRSVYVDLNHVLTAPTQLPIVDSVIESVIDSVTYPVLTQSPTPYFHCHPLPSFPFLSYTFPCVYIEVLEPHFNRQSPHSILMIGARISDLQYPLQRRGNLV